MLTLRRPDLVLSSISYPALAGATRAGIAAVGLSSLSWDVVLHSYLDASEPEDLALVEQIAQAYAAALLMIRLQPSVPLRAFRRLIDVGPIAEPIEPDRRTLRQAAGASDDEPVVVVAFGGMLRNALPFQDMESMHPFRFIVSGSVPESSTRLVALEAVPLAFRCVLGSADVLITKPGYGTLVEAVAAHVPVVYVRRYNFLDEASLIDYLGRFGRAVELAPDAFARGDWKEALEQALAWPAPREPAPPSTEAEDAARLLDEWL